MKNIVLMVWMVSSNGLMTPAICVWCQRGFDLTPDTDIALFGIPENPNFTLAVDINDAGNGDLACATKKNTSDKRHLLFLDGSLS